MLRWEFVFLLVVLISSIAGILLPEGSAALLVSKGVFGLGFVLFAAALLRSQNLYRNDFGSGRRGSSKPI